MPAIEYPNGFTDQELARLLYVKARYENQQRIDQIKDKINFYRKEKLACHVETFGISLGLPVHLNQNLEMANRNFEDSLSPDQNPLIKNPTIEESERIARIVV